MAETVYRIAAVVAGVAIIVAITHARVACEAVSVASVSVIPAV